jgi:hypothetical protein
MQDLISALPHPIVMAVHDALLILRRASFASRKHQKSCLKGIAMIAQACATEWNAVPDVSY